LERNWELGSFKKGNRENAAQYINWKMIVGRKWADLKKETPQYLKLENDCGKVVHLCWVHHQATLFPHFPTTVG
jgi:hypothetical protein